MFTQETRYRQSARLRSNAGAKRDSHLPRPRHECTASPRPDPARPRPEAARSAPAAGRKGRRAAAQRRDVAGAPEEAALLHVPGAPGACPLARPRYDCPECAGAARTRACVAAHEVQLTPCVFASHCRQRCRDTPPSASPSAHAKAPVVVSSTRCSTSTCARRCATSGARARRTRARSRRSRARPRSVCRRTARQARPPLHCRPRHPHPRPCLAHGLS